MGLKTPKEAYPLPLRGDYVGGTCWQLTAPFEYCNPPDRAVVPIGFITDGASIPKIAWILIGSPWSGKYAKAAVVHDYQCVEEYDRKRTDRIFLDGMEILGVPKWKRTAMFWAVRIWGMF